MCGEGLLVCYGEVYMKGITFDQGCVPRLLYATKQAVADPKVNRSIHRHEDVAELLFVYHGEGIYIVDGYSYEVRAGDLLLYNMGDLHEVTSSTAHEIGTFCFGISGLRLIGCAEGWMTDAGQGFVRPVGARYHEIYHLCRLVDEQMEQNTPQGNAIVSHLFPGLVLLALTFEADLRSRSQDTDQVLANRIRQYIATHFTDALTLERLGKELHLSPYYAAHVFKNITGFSPIQYMIRCRIGEAQNLLISTDYTATQIAALVGYNSINHFNAMFSKTVGLPPIQYRKQYLESIKGKRGQ